jgi:hypothetical protein
MMPTQNLNQDKGDLEYSKSGESIRQALCIVSICIYFDPFFFETGARHGGQPSLAVPVNETAEWLERLCHV